MNRTIVNTQMPWKIVISNFETILFSGNICKCHTTCTKQLIALQKIPLKFFKTSKLIRNKIHKGIIHIMFPGVSESISGF